MSDSLSEWTLVFDLDGTLVESAPDLHAALNHTLERKKLGPVPLSEIRMMIGDGAKALIRKGLSWHDQAIDEDEINQLLWPSFIDHYLDNICRLSHLYEDVQPSLDRFAETGARMAVCTNKTQNLAEEVLKGLKIAPYFKAIIGGDAVASKKPDGRHILETITLADGQADKAIMIGDSQTDERAARDAQLPFVFVSFGYGTLSEGPEPTTLIVDHWQDMQDAIAKTTDLNR